MPSIKDKLKAEECNECTVNTAKTTETVSDERLDRYMGGRYGQHSETRERYAEAIRACSDIGYLGKTVAEIAREFGHQPETFRMMLKRHYMDVLNERERLRQLLGLNKLPPRGLGQATRQKYQPAIDLLRRHEDMTIREAAERTGVSLPSLQQHIIFYHKDLAQQRLMQRVARLDNPREQGRLTAVGRTAGPRGTAGEYYREAVGMAAGHPELTLRQIAVATGTGVHNLSSYMQRWHRDVMQQREEWRRRQTAQRQAERALHNQDTTKQAKARRKYAPALPLIEQGMSYDEAARETGVDRDQLLSWVRHNRPDLHQRERQSQWVTLPAGVRIRRSSWQRFQEAARDYLATDEPISSIARRHGLRPTSLGNFLRRTFPDAVEARRRQRMSH